MTVIAQNTSVTYTSTGSVGPYAFNFPISSADSLKVIQNNVLLSSSAYTVTPLNNNFDNGGSVTLNVAPPVGQTLLLQRSTPLTQTSVYTDNMPTPLKSFENSLDKLTEMVQEIAASSAGLGGVGVPFAGVPIGTIDGTNRVFTFATPAAPTALFVWLNFPLIVNVGYTASWSAGVLTITYIGEFAPQPGPVAPDSLYVQGFYPSGVPCGCP